MVVGVLFYYNKNALHSQIPQIQTDSLFLNKIGNQELINSSFIQDQSNLILNSIRNKAFNMKCSEIHFSNYSGKMQDDTLVNEWNSSNVEGYFDLQLFSIPLKLVGGVERIQNLGAAKYKGLFSVAVDFDMLKKIKEKTVIITPQLFSTIALREDLLDTTNKYVNQKVGQMLTKPMIIDSTYFKKYEIVHDTIIKTNNNLLIQKEKRIGIIADSIKTLNNQGNNLSLYSDPSYWESKEKLKRLKFIKKYHAINQIINRLTDFQIGTQIVNNSTLTSKYLPVQALNFSGNVYNYEYTVQGGIPAVKGINSLFNSGFVQSLGYSGNYYFIRIGQNNQDQKISISYQAMRRSTQTGKSEPQAVSNVNTILSLSIDRSIKDRGQFNLEYAISGYKESYGNANKDLFAIDSNFYKKSALEIKFNYLLWKSLSTECKYSHIGIKYKTQGNIYLIPGMDDISLKFHGKLFKKISYYFGGNLVITNNGSQVNRIKKYANLKIQWKCMKNTELSLAYAPGATMYSNQDQISTSNIKQFYTYSLKNHIKLGKLNVHNALIYSNQKQNISTLDSTNYYRTASWNHYLTVIVKNVYIKTEFINASDGKNLYDIVFKAGYKTKLINLNAGTQYGNYYLSNSIYKGINMQMQLNKPNLGFDFQGRLLATNFNKLLSGHWEFFVNTTYRFKQPKKEQL